MSSMEQDTRPTLPGNTSMASFPRQAYEREETARNAPAYTRAPQNEDGVYRPRWSAVQDHEPQTGQSYEPQYAMPPRRDERERSAANTQNVYGNRHIPERAEPAEDYPSARAPPQDRYATHSEQSRPSRYDMLSSHASSREYAPQEEVRQPYRSPPRHYPESPRQAQRSNRYDDGYLRPMSRHDDRCYDPLPRQGGHEGISRQDQSYNVFRPSVHRITTPPPRETVRESQTRPCHASEARPAPVSSVPAPSAAHIRGSTPREHEPPRKPSHASSIPAAPRPGGGSPRVSTPPKQVIQSFSDKLGAAKTPPPPARSKPEPVAYFGNLPEGFNPMAHIPLIHHNGTMTKQLHGLWISMLERVEHKHARYIHLLPAFSVPVPHGVDVYQCLLSHKKKITDHFPHIFFEVLSDGQKTRGANLQVPCIQVKFHSSHDKDNDLHTRPALVQQALIAWHNLYEWIEHIMETGNRSDAKRPSVKTFLEFLNSRLEHKHIMSSGLRSMDLLEAVFLSDFSRFNIGHEEITPPKPPPRAAQAPRSPTPHHRGGTYATRGRGSYRGHGPSCGHVGVGDVNDEDDSQMGDLDPPEEPNEENGRPPRPDTPPRPTKPRDEYIDFASCPVSHKADIFHLPKGIPSDATMRFALKSIQFRSPFSNVLPIARLPSSLSKASSQQQQPPAILHRYRGE